MPEWNVPRVYCLGSVRLSVCLYERLASDFKFSKKTTFELFLVRCTYLAYLPLWSSTCGWYCSIEQCVTLTFWSPQYIKQMHKPFVFFFLEYFEIFCCIKRADTFTLLFFECSTYFADCWNCYAQRSIYDLEHSTYMYMYNIDRLTACRCRTIGILYNN